jgi:autotransporter-associated beta strand protein
MDSLGDTTMGTTVAPGATLHAIGDGLTIAEPLTLAGEGVSDRGALYVTADDFIATNVTLCCNVDATVSVATGHIARINGGINGSVGLRKAGLGTLILAGASNTYTGLTTNARGTLVLDKVNAVPAGLRVVVDTVRLEANQAILGAVEVEAFGTFNLNGHSETIEALQGYGAVQLGSGMLTIFSQTVDSFFNGTINGTGQVIRNGNASMRLAGVHAFGNLNTFGPGVLRVDGLVDNSVIANGPLRGTGTLGTLTAGGVVEPGDGTAPGVLRTKNVTLTPEASVHLKIHGATPGTGYSQLHVTGTVSLGNAQLAIAAGGGEALHGAQYVIIDNDGTDAIDGTFQNLAEGAIIKQNGRTFRISYAGGTGNDIVLTALVVEYHLSEGATGAFFDTDLLVANPNNTAAPIDVQFLKPGGEIVAQSYLVPALSHLTIRVDEVSGLQNTEVSTIVTSVDALPIVVERTMRWDSNGYGAHTEKAVGGPSTTWYFAEGAQGFFSTYLLLANPNAAANTATVEYLREGTTPLVRTYPLDPFARVTVDIGADSELMGRSFGMTVIFATAGVAERSMYFGLSPLWNAGHESAGVPAPATSWFLAEGATGGFFETFVLVANPNDEPTDATFRFLLESGGAITTTKTIPARSRLTVNIEAEDPALANASVATAIEATRPVVVERAQYWPDPAPSWYEAHNSFGVTEAAGSWGFAEGRVGGPAGYQTYILLANPDAAKTAEVTLTFLREGKPSFTKTFTVNPASRFTVSTGPGSHVPELQDEYFGVKIAATEPIVAERAMYANANGQVWGAGTNATATRLP